MSGSGGTGVREGGDGGFGTGGRGAQCGTATNTGDYICHYAGGGGGGGGYYGGGGGAGGNLGRGGGGSSVFGPDGVVFESGVRAGNGLVRIIYTLPPTDTSPPTTTIALDPSSPDGKNGEPLRRPLPRRCKSGVGGGQAPADAWSRPERACTASPSTRSLTWRKRSSAAG
jgi:hypothetical protein